MTKQLNLLALFAEVIIITWVRWLLFNEVARYLPATQYFGVEFSIYFFSVGVLWLLYGAVFGLVLGLTQAVTVRISVAKSIPWLWRSTIVLSLWAVGGGLAQGVTKRLIDLMYNFHIASGLWENISSTVMLLVLIIQGISLGLLQSRIWPEAAQQKTLWVLYVTVSWTLCSSIAFMHLSPAYSSRMQTWWPPQFDITTPVYIGTILIFVIIERFCLSRYFGELQTTISKMEP